MQKHNEEELEQITNKRNNYMNYFMHCASKSIVNICTARDITCIVIGKNKHWKTESSMSKLVNQTFVQIPYNSFISKLRYKCKEANIELIEELKTESKRAHFEGLTEEELELYDLLIKGKRLTNAEEQAVKLAAKDIFKKLTTEKSQLFVVDWYKDELPKAKVKKTIEDVLDVDLPVCYDKESFDSKTNLLLNHFIDMSIQHYGWICA